MKKYGCAILNILLDQYERSKSFIGENKQNQSFRKRVDDLFPDYADAAQYDVFSGVNEQVQNLEKAGLIMVKRNKRGKMETDVIASVQLNIEKLSDAYKFLGRKPKADRNDEILNLLHQYMNCTPLLHDFCQEQVNRIKGNKKPHYSDDLDKLEQILKVLVEIEKIEKEVFIRNFSIRVLGDSKAFEKIKTSVVSILCKYGAYTDKDHVLQNLNIVSNPGYVYAKGNGQITISGQVIDLGGLNGDLGLSSVLLDSIEDVKVYASKVITIENLTTFNSYDDKDAFAIYLGGYHNSIRRKFIRKIYELNSDKSYYHYGDIDSGGFNILLDLRIKTGISFAPFNMDVITLEKYKDYTQKLTENDRSRLKNLLGGEFDLVIRYMLEHDCKLEQEAIEQPQ